jgi:hypothetical protein
MRVAIVGSRKYTNRRKIQEFVFKLKEKWGNDLEVVSGGQRDGADGYAKKYSLEFGVKYSEFPPKHYQYNQHCVLESYNYGRKYATCDVMVAFLPKDIISKGTESALKEATKRAKKVVIIN